MSLFVGRHRELERIFIRNGKYSQGIQDNYPPEFEIIIIFKNIFFFEWFYVYGLNLDDSLF